MKPGQEKLSGCQGPFRLDGRNRSATLASYPIRGPDIRSAILPKNRRTDSTRRFPAALRGVTVYRPDPTMGCEVGPRLEGSIALRVRVNAGPLET